MFSWIKKPLLSLMLLASSLAWGQTVAFYTDRALGVNPFTPGAGGTPSPVFLPFAQVRVCTLPLTLNTPCPTPASITDIFGNPISIVGGNFGQLTTDVVGRFSFGCFPGLYQVQVQATGSNTPALTYPITCPALALSVPPNTTVCNASLEFSAAIAAALALVQASGGTVDCSSFAGTSNWTSQVVLNKPVQLLLGDGNYNCPASLGAPAITITASGVQIAGRGYNTNITCNLGDVAIISAINVSNIRVSNLRISNTHVAAGMDTGANQNITFNVATNVVADHVWSIAGRGFLFKQVTGGWFTDNYITGNQDGCFFANGSGGGIASTDIHVTNNTCVNPTDTTISGPPQAFNFEDTDNSVASGNTCDLNGNFNADALSSCFQVFPNNDAAIHHFVLADNTAVKNPSGFINCIDVGGPNLYVELDIHDNTCDGFNNGISGSGFTSNSFTASSFHHNHFLNLSNVAIQLICGNGTAVECAATDLTLDGNTSNNSGLTAYRIVQMSGMKVQNNKSYKAGGNGISCEGCQNTTFENNVIADSSFGHSGTSDGIVQTTSNTETPDNNTYRGNHSYDDQGGSATQRNGLNLISGSNTFVGGNYLHNNTNIQLNDLGTGSIYDFQAGVGVPTSNCANGGVYRRTDAVSASTVEYVCNANTWSAVGVP